MRFSRAATRSFHEERGFGGAGGAGEQPKVAAIAPPAMLEVRNPRRDTITRRV
jgi:hypothetical protein